MFEISRRKFLSTSALGLATLALPFAAQAAGRDKTMRYVTPGVINSLDPVAFTATTESTSLGSAIYDRLIAFGRKPQGDDYVFDFDEIKGSLAEHYEVSADGLTLTFHLRKGALWHDGTPVTAEDIKWSLERAVSAETMSKAQMETGSINKDARFETEGDAIVRIVLARSDRLALPNLTTLYVPMINSRLVKQHVSEADPWGLEWLKSNTAGGGAFMVERFVPGEQVVLKRNDQWINGTLPGMEKVIVQTVPAAATRRNLIERGDADIAVQLQSADVVDLEKLNSVRIASMPMPTAFIAMIFNTRMVPFDNVLVRQAISAALPYDDLVTIAALGRGQKLAGAQWPDNQPPNGQFPQVMPDHTDLERAKRLMAEAGFKDGFDTTLSYGAIRSAWADLAAPLVQEALAKIGIRVKIEKLPDAKFSEAITNKTIAMMLERSLSYFPVTDYFFRVFLSGEQRWNMASWKNPRIDALLPQARFETDQAKYDAMVREMIMTFEQEKPMIFLWRPNLDVAMVPSLSGFTVWPFYYLDIRDPVRKA